MEAGGEGDGDGSGEGGSPEREPEIDQVDESVEKHNRNPRWLQNETLALVAAKRKQSEGNLGAVAAGARGSRNITADEKWEAVSAYCRANNCQRTASQCKKRWFALYGDYNKVKEWHRISNGESYWAMKNDRRRENRLPGSFDQVIFSSMHEWLRKDSDVDFDTPRRVEEIISSVEQDVEGQESPDMGGGDGNSDPRSEHNGDPGDKRYRNPRWSLHESLILLAAKKKQEDDSGMVPKTRVRTVSADERWETISIHCRAHGCERNAYQCRKRWSALLGDFKRIREWQKVSHESYWLMKNEKRKENKLPAIFDHEVFSNMDTWVGKRIGKKLGTVTSCLTACDQPGQQPFDLEHDQGGLLGRVSDVEHDQGGLVGPISDVEHNQCGDLEPDSAKEPSCPSYTILESELGTNSQEEQPSDESTARKKRKRVLDGDNVCDSKGQNLATVFKSSVKEMQAALAENMQMQMQAHLTNFQFQIESLNRNSQLDRAQRKEQGEKLVGVLAKLADALGKIAEKPEQGEKGPLVGVLAKLADALGKIAEKPP